MNDSVAKALLVMVTDPKINTFLQQNDPQALKQATTALREYFDQFEDNLTTSQYVDKVSAQYNKGV